MLIWLIIACGTVVISDRLALLETAKDLKSKTFSSVIKFLIRYSLRTLSIFTIWLLKFISRSSFLLWEKSTTNIFIVSFVRLRNFMPQSTTYTPFSVPILAILHFLVLGLSPERNYEKKLWKKLWKNSQKMSKISKTEFLSFKKKLVSSP